MKTRLALGLALAACHPSPAPTAPGAIPGLRWSTPAQPWHLPHPLFSFAADGDDALIGSADGWLTRIDLRSGRVVADRQVRTAGLAPSLHGLASLGGGRWIAVGLDDAHLVTYLIDGATLATTPIVIATDRTILRAIPEVARLADGGVVIASKALPLAIYDPYDWNVRTVVDPQVGWQHLRVRGNVIGAYHAGAAIRFDLATHDRTPIGTSLRFDVSPTHTATGQRVDDARGEDQVVRVLGERTPLDLADHVVTFAFDASGSRLVTTHLGQVWVHAMPSGAVTSRADLGITGLDAPHWLATDGDRAFTVVNQILRVVDLATGRVSPGGDPVWGTARELAVGTDGTILVLGGNNAWQFANGSIVTATPFVGSALGVRTTDPTRFLAGVPGRIDLRTAFGGTVRSWEIQLEATGVWPGTDGWLGDFDGLVGRSTGPAIETLFERASDANVLDADPDSGDVLIRSQAVMHVIRATAPTAPRRELRVPGCEDIFSNGALEPRGKRAATWSTHEVAMWDRTTGALLGAARFTDVIDEVVFIPNTSTVLLRNHDHLVVWTPGGEARTQLVPGYVDAELSADGRLLALGFHDGKVALVDFARFVAGLAAGSVPPRAVVPASCPTVSPIR